MPGHDYEIYLDKTLDCSPPCYELYYFEPKDGIIANATVATIITVNGKQFFGAGLTWNQAVKLAEQIIERCFDTDSDNVSTKE